MGLVGNGIGGESPDRGVGFKAAMGAVEDFDAGAFVGGLWMMLLGTISAAMFPQAEISAAVKEPAIRDKLLAAAVDPAGLSPAEFSAFLAKERATYTRVQKARNIRADD